MAQGFLQIAIFCALIVAVVPLLGGHMARVFRGERTFLDPVAGPLERVTYRLLRVDPARGQDWKVYARSVILFSLAGWLVLFLILRTQTLHPFNPENFHSGTWDLSFNTASSFVTNTNWQFYGGETTLSYFSQMAGLTVQNFVSAATGIAVAIALIRGIIARRSATPTLGNFWQDLVRATFYVLLPISIVGAVLLVSQGVLQTLGGTVAGLARGPVASQEAIKELGTNGGGFFNVNSAYPFENATALSNLIEIFLILCIPASLTYTYGRMVGSRRQGWAIFAAMSTLFIASVVVVYLAELHGTPAQHAAGIHTGAIDGSTGGNMEGKDVRFGIANSTLVGGGHHGHLVRRGQRGDRVADRHRRPRPDGRPGLRRVGLRRRRDRPLHDAALRPARRLHRRPDGRAHARVPGQEGRGARDQARLARGARHAAGRPARHGRWRWATKYGEPSIFASGPQGFSESLYAYMSQANNNGSAFAGYTGYYQPNPGNIGAHGITFADLLGGVTMLGARFAPIILVLAVAGALAGKRVAPQGLGTLRTDTPTFVRAARRRGRAHRRPDLLPRPPPRPRRAGHDRSAVLT